MVVVHEVEKGVSELAKAVQREVDIERVRALANHLSELIQGLGFLTRKSGQRKERASVLVRQSLFDLSSGPRA